MGYIGRDAYIGNYRRFDNISSQFDGIKKTFPLTVSSQTITAPGLATQFLVCVDGALLEPNNHFTITSGSITFSVAPKAGSYCWILELGSVWDTGRPSGGSISNEMLQTRYVPFSLAQDQQNQIYSSANSYPNTPALDIKIGSDDSVHEKFGEGISRNRYIACGETGVIVTQAGAKIIQEERYNKDVVSPGQNNFPDTYQKRSRKVLKGVGYSAVSDIPVDYVFGLQLGTIPTNNSPGVLIKLFEANPTTNSEVNFIQGTVTALCVDKSAFDYTRSWDLIIVDSSGKASGHTVEIKESLNQDLQGYQLKLIVATDPVDSKKYYYIDTDGLTQRPATFFFSGLISINLGANSFGSVVASATVQTITQCEIKKTSAISIPAGSSAQRPALNSASRVIRFNTDSNSFEGFIAGDWVSFTTGGGTGGILLPKGTTAQRAADEAYIRYNTDLKTAEVSSKDKAGNVLWYPSGIASPQPNLLLNGNFATRQRGDILSNIAGGAYLYDRWCFISNVGAARISASLPAFSGTYPANRIGWNNPPLFFADFNAVNVASGVGNYVALRHVTEGVTGIPDNVPLVLSFWAGSSAPTTINITISQQFGFPGSGGSAPTVTSVGYNIPITTTKQLFVFPFTLPSVAGKVIGTDPQVTTDFQFVDATTNLSLSNVKIEHGNVFTGWAPHPNEEKCLRYFWKPTFSVSFVDTAGIVGQWVGTVAQPIMFPCYPDTTMYKLPTVRIGAATSTANIQNIRAEGLNTASARIVADSIAVGFTNGWLGDFDFTAELSVY